MFNVIELKAPKSYSNEGLHQCAKEMGLIVEKSLSKLETISPTLREQYQSTLNWIELANQNYDSKDPYFDEINNALKKCFNWITVAINKSSLADPNVKQVLEHFLALAQQFDVVQMRTWRFQIQNPLAQRQQELPTPTVAELTESVASLAIDAPPAHTQAQQALTASSSSTPSSSQSMDTIESSEEQVAEEEGETLGRFCFRRSQKKLTTSFSSLAIEASATYTPARQLTVTSSSTPSPDPVILGLNAEIMPDADLTQEQDNDGVVLSKFCFHRT